MTRIILLFIGFFLIIILFTEEFARALDRLRAALRRHPRYRIIVYPLLLVLIVAAALVIAVTLIDFSTGILFSYD